MGSRNVLLCFMYMFLACILGLQNPAASENPCPLPHTRWGPPCTNDFYLKTVQFCMNKCPETLTSIAGEPAETFLDTSAGCSLTSMSSPTLSCALFKPACLCYNLQDMDFRGIKANRHELKCRLTRIDADWRPGEQFL